MIRFRHKTPLKKVGDGQVLIDVRYSSLNYKDALAFQDPSRILRRLPLIPGIDAAGVVLESSSEQIDNGTRVIITGNGYGESRHGGYSSKLYADVSHVIPLPESVSLKDAATLGTAGITAALAISALRQVKIPLASPTLPIAVSGASGGVGSLALSMLASEKLPAVAITGSLDEADFLRDLGASEVISRNEFLEPSHKPLLPARFSGAIDQVGGSVLSKLLASTAPEGLIASCGLALSSDIGTSLMPFILRGVTLRGINSVDASQKTRGEIWDYFGKNIPKLQLDKISTTIALQDLKLYTHKILSGKTRGRITVEIPH